MNKSLLCMLSITSITILFAYLAQWQNPSVRLDLYPKTQQEFYEIIIHNSEGKQKIVNSIGNIFDVHYIENMPIDSVNPYFPAIYIANDVCDAWLHIVTTDSKLQPEFCHFIDSDKSVVGLYPFYTKNNIFTDQPAWGYGFFNKPLNYWIGHAWAIKLDEQNKTIKCLGGISWGYTLTKCSFKPTMILPTSLTLQDWQEDWKMYQQALPDYQDITQ